MDEPISFAPHRCLSLRRPLSVACLAACSLSLGGFTFSGQAQEATPGTNSDAPPLPAPALVQEKVREWVNVQKIRAEEAAQWEDEKRRLADLNEIRRKEIAKLDEVIEAAGTRLTDAEKQRTDLLAEEQDLRGDRAAWEKDLEALEETARELLPALPPPLRDKVADAEDRLTKPDPSAPLQNRFRDVLAILTEAENFNATITVDSELREFDGQEVELQVLYLGLGQAYYCDRAGKQAGFGLPGADGWTWTSRPALAPEIQKAIKVHQKSATPELVTLPVKLSQQP